MQLVSELNLLYASRILFHSSEKNMLFSNRETLIPVVFCETVLDQTENEFFFLF